MTDKTSQTTRKTIAYLRVSTLDQDIEKNKANILHFANHHDLGKAHFVEEIASGRTPWRARRIAQVLEEGCVPLIQEQIWGLNRADRRWTSQGI